MHVRSDGCICDDCKRIDDCDVRRGIMDVQEALHITDVGMEIWLRIEVEECGEYEDTGD